MNFLQDVGLCGQAKDIAEAVKSFELEEEGYPVKDITVVLANRSLIIIFEGGLSALELSLVKSVNGAAQVEEFHKHMVNRPRTTLWQKITEITGCGLANEDEGGVPSACVKVFANGTVLHVCQLAERVPTSIWSESTNDLPLLPGTNT